jgi:DNA gyrase subunit B
MAKKYDESQIERYAGLAGVRKKPTPYIGETNGDGLWTCWREPCDNAVDQALAGRNKSVHLVYDSEPNRYWVLDKGEGIPVGTKVFENERGVKEKLSVFYVVTGLTHAGANFSGDTISRGTHGIGIKATNAMSKVFKVWTYRDDAWWCIEYKDAKLSKEPYKAKGPPKLPHGLKAKKGTIVMFEPDLSLFRKGAAINPKDLQSWCQLTSYLVPGMEVMFTNPKGKTFTLVNKRGVLDYIDKAVEELKCTANKKVFHHDSKIADIAIAFTDAEGDNIKAYTNGLLNKDGGEHQRANLDAMYKTLQPMMKKIKGDKKGTTKWPFTAEDLSDGLVGLVNYKISAPQFNNQPKDKLIDERVYDPAFKEFSTAWAKFWKANPGLTKDIIKRATELRSKTADFLKDKKLIKNVNAAKKSMSTKLAGIIGSAPVERRELFLVEGDSAGGGAKKARDKTFQAIYPLRGKPLNPIDAKKEKVSNNEEIVGLLAALGMDLNAKSEEKMVKTIQYGKIIQLADPDVDGMHINCILTAILWQFTPHLIKGGHVYGVKAPLYKGVKGDKIFFGMTKAEVYKKAGTEKLEVTYIKGWGEINVEDLGEALDPGRRKLFRITAPDAKQASEFLQLMGGKTAYRKQLLGIVE